MNHYEEIKGEVIQIIYSNIDANFAVIKVKDINKNNTLTATGKIQSPKVGAIVKLRGYWEKHRKHGVQFKTISSAIALPDTLAGIMKYLGAGFVEAVGPRSARKIVEYFGADTANVIENEIEKLILVPGIGPGRLRNIQLAWNDQKIFNVAIKKKLLS